MKSIEIINKAIEALMNRKDRSSWEKAVTDDALILIYEVAAGIVEGHIEPEALQSRGRLEGAMLNGATTWSEYRGGGAALIYDGDIARHYCTPSEYRRKRGGQLRPNSRETWLDVQARALWQAARRVQEAVEAAIEAVEEEERDAVPAA